MEQVLFHATSNKFISDIRKEGLRIKKTSLEQFLYFSEEMDAAVSSILKKKDLDIHKIIVLGVRAKDLSPSYIFDDPTTNGIFNCNVNHTHWTSNKAPFIAYGTNIPREKIGIYNFNKRRFENITKISKLSRDYYFKADTVRKLSEEEINRIRSKYMNSMSVCKKVEKLNLAVREFSSKPGGPISSTKDVIGFDIYNPAVTNENNYEDCRHICIRFYGYGDQNIILSGNGQMVGFNILDCTSQFKWKECVPLFVQYIINNKQAGSTVEELKKILYK